MKVLLIKPGKKPETVDIESGLESLQEMVGGSIQVVYPFDDLVGLIVNDEGRSTLYYEVRIIRKNYYHRRKIIC